MFKQDYYGKILKTSSDLKTDVCVTPSKPIPPFIRQALKRVHPEVNARSLGSGLLSSLVVLLPVCSY